MGFKKFTKSLMLIVFIACLVTIPNFANAAEITPPLYFGINEMRGDLGYAIGNPNTNETEGNASAAKIWNILQYSDANGNGPTNANVYCVKAGEGFTEGAGTKEIQEYNLQFDMYTERSAIAAVDADSSSVLNGLVNGGHYNELLAVANLIYIPGESTEQEREQLLSDSGVLNIQREYEGLGDENYNITDEEIEAVQQAAMWYFTNYGEENNKYDKTDDTGWLYYTEDGTNYSNLTSYGSEEYPSYGEARQLQAEALYSYLIEEAQEQAVNYVKNSENTTYRHKLTLYTSSTDHTSQPLMEVEKNTLEFDLSLRKYITEVNGVAVENSRIPNIDTSTLESETTASYAHRKDPVEVEIGDTVTYQITIYNEGEVAGRATEIIDQLPTGLRYVANNSSENFDIVYDEETNRITLTRKNDNNLVAYDGGETLASETIEIECTVEAGENDTVLTNVAWISNAIDEYGNVIDQVGEDRDSEPGTKPNVNKDNMEDYKGNTDNQDDLTDPNYFYEGEQDDDDFEKLIVKSSDIFDLKLIKRITEINGEEVPERLLGVDITNLANGTATTADYQMNKAPISVSTGDLITYTFRIYNEGNIDGYVEEITEDIPEGLEFLGADIDANMNPITDEEELEAVEFNTSMGWTYVEGDSTKISTDYLGRGKGEEITTPGANLIKAFDSNSAYSDTETNKNPDYKEISVIFKVTAENPDVGIIRNEAAITEDANSNGDPVDDRDSSTDNWVKYEDDEDYDNVILQEFDLALRKFITKVDEEDITTRIPEVSYDREEDQITYEHTKEPVEVATGNIVEYTIRVYNEGDMAGYANSVSDDIPDGLRYLPENETNIEYRWVMYDEEGNVTDNVEEAVEIRTDYLSKEQGEERLAEGETANNPNLLEAFNPNEEIGEGNPDYRDIKVAFEVVEPNTSDKIIINSAQISDDSDENGNPVEDIDSIPDEWNDGEDDQDREYIKLTYFDLSLRKWVTEAIVIENGEETITQTGHTAEMDPEPVVKVELYRKNLSDVTVKFRYSVRITNEGDIAGYATEITDYVPAGLRFIAEDNSGWTDEGNNVISTRLLENTLLQPGESAEVEVVLTWINGEDNMGEMTNTAEISEDYNDKNVPDRDSTPDNQIPGEDDIDDAPVLLSIETGRQRIYFALGLTVLGTLAGGLVLIKKFVL